MGTIAAICKRSQHQLRHWYTKRNSKGIYAYAYISNRNNISKCKSRCCSSVVFYSGPNASCCGVFSVCNAVCACGRHTISILVYTSQATWYHQYFLPVFSTPPHTLGLVCLVFRSVGVRLSNGNWGGKSTAKTDWIDCGKAMENTFGGWEKNESHMQTLHTLLIRMRGMGVCVQTSVEEFVL